MIDEQIKEKNMAWKLHFVMTPSLFSDVFPVLSEVADTIYINDAFYMWGHYNDIVKALDGREIQYILNPISSYELVGDLNFVKAWLVQHMTEQAIQNKVQENPEAFADFVRGLEKI